MAVFRLSWRILTDREILHLKIAPIARTITSPEVIGACYTTHYCRIYEIIWHRNYTKCRRFRSYWCRHSAQLLTLVASLV